jgi:hypothetical protein
MKLPLANSPICASKAHCVTCRDRAKGITWRRSLRKRYGVPGDQDDFDCPHDVPWGIGGDYSLQGHAVVEVRHRAEGWGDRLEKLLALVGIGQLKKLYEQATGEKCGCNARRLWLNAFGEADWRKRKRMLRQLLAASRGDQFSKE